MRKRKELNTVDQEYQKREKRVEETTPVNAKLLLFLAAAAFLIMIFNQFQLLSIASLAEGRPLATGISLVAASVAPTGVPAIYGSELSISYDDVSANDSQKADQIIR